MRYFFSTGESSGELAATLLAREIRRIDTSAQFEGIGSTRMRENGFMLWRDSTGWASFGPFAALPNIPKLTVALLSAVRHILKTDPDMVILVDFGAFNIRLAQRLRRAGYRKPILDMFPPGAWLDSEKTARAVSAVATPLPAFAHQRDFYTAHGLKVQYFGHPLAAQYAMREPRPAPPADDGTVALLPGSRNAELRYHVPVLLEAFKELQNRRPHLHGIVGSANERAERAVRAYARGHGVTSLTYVRGTAAAITGADAAFVASGTAVLECALSGVPIVALYIVSRALARYFLRIYSRRFVTLPNLILDRDAVPELLQDRATPARLAQTMHALLRDPAGQYESFTELRRALGPDDALAACARFAVELAQGRSC